MLSGEETEEETKQHIIWELTDYLRFAPDIYVEMDLTVTHNSLMKNNLAA